MNGQKVIDPELALYALEDADPLTDKRTQSITISWRGLKKRRKLQLNYS